MTETSETPAQEKQKSNIGEVLVKNAEVVQKMRKEKREAAGEGRKYLENIAGKGQVKRVIKGVQKQ